MMNTLLKHHHCCPPHLHLLFTIPSITKPSNSFSPTKLTIPFNSNNTLSPSFSLSSFTPKASNFSNPISSIWVNGEEKDSNFDGGSGQIDDLAHDSPVYQKTLRLVECSMFAAVAGLAYLLSNSLAIENYFGCFFALPIVITSMRWGVAAGRKTMVATTVLLFVLSGPVKALTYVLLHGILGFTMGSLWRLRVNWRLSIFLCTLVRAIGALGYVLTSSFLISENILALITINVHATLTMIFNSLGFTTVPSMNTIYGIFGTLLLMNCCFFVFLLHILYSLFLTRLGMKSSLMMPKWLERAL
ncbi:uncharacterized protein LOC141644015 [Silene latifolia]|uniref:uncharacterized protein LOC141644015 n=1 Tax=Silene latifolia TaxID=37657 RepID=UPI003D77318F